MEITSTNIAAHFVTCMKCDKVWRTEKSMLCPHCEGAYGKPFLLDPLSVSQLMDAMRDFLDEDEYTGEEQDMRLALAMEDNCAWYNDEDPWYIQACWRIIQAKRFEGAFATDIGPAVDLFEARFRERVVLVNEDGNIPRV